VQTHLSGLSADILLMHLKKLLGRRRTLFVLLSPPDQVGEQVLKLYHGHIDSSLSDQPLSGAILELISTLTTRKKKTTALPQTNAAASTDFVQLPDGEPVIVGPLSSSSWNGNNLLERDLSVQSDVQPTAETPWDALEPTLEEQGVVYAPRPLTPVYAEFTSTLDNAVSFMATPEAPAEALSNPAHDGMYARAESSVHDRGQPRSKTISFLLWLVPVVIVVVVITILQYRSIQPTSIDVAANRPVMPAGKPSAAVKVPVESKKPSSTPASPDQKPAALPSATETDARMSDRAVLSAIAENRAVKTPAPEVALKNRPRVLPVFIPRAGLDKAYGASNPGWERYKGMVTEFKVFREGEFIKAIQVIDRGGRGVPEEFMRAVLQQLTKAPSYAVVSSEKKEGYEIQRGQIADNLKAVYYRDMEGGRLRAFVVTWQ